MSASAGKDMVLKVWEATSGKSRSSFPISQTAASAGHTKKANAMDFSPDSSRIVTGSDDGKAIVWEVVTGKPLLVLTGHTKPVNAVDFSPDGAWIATGSADGTARIWDGYSGQLQHSLSTQYLVRDVIFSPDNKRLLTGGLDNTTRVWDVQTGKELLVLRGQSKAVDHVAFSPEGKLIATASEGEETIKVWDAATGQELMTFPGLDAEFGPDENSLLVFGKDGIAARLLPGYRAVGCTCPLAGHTHADHCGMPTVLAHT